MAAEQDSNTAHQDTEVVESFLSSGELDRPSFQDNNGHFLSSPEENTFTPTSVIYFKEALNSASVQFGKKGLDPPATVKYEFHIETTKKTKSEWFNRMFLFLEVLYIVCAREPRQLA